MALESDGDVVRGLGFVTLYAAYLEEEVDALLDLLSSVDSSPEKHKRWPISQRLKKAIRVLKTLESDELEDLRRDLEAEISLRNGTKLCMEESTPATGVAITPNFVRVETAFQIAT